MNTGAKRSTSAVYFYASLLLIGLFFCCFTTYLISFHIENDVVRQANHAHEPKSIVSRLLRSKISFGFINREKEMPTRPSRRNATSHHNVVTDGWSRGPLTIFYNIYIPPAQQLNDVEKALEIVKEQLQQIGLSPTSHQPLTLHYNLLGNVNALNITQMDNWCSDASSLLHCNRLNTYPSGTERLTLQELWGFCQKNPGHRVTYIHSKGSYHPSDKNTHWRRLLTAAALSPKCANPPNNSCNLCGLQFFTQFTFFVPGNMFTASCNYVRMLLPLSDYVTRQEQHVKKKLVLRLRNQLRSSLLWDQLDYWGLDRYADEHWIGSHPDVVPCDMDPHSDIANVFNGSLGEDQLVWSMGPRTNGIVGGINDELQSSIRSTESLRLREILLLPGLLIRWWTLYNIVPATDSWIWKFFPDGSFWQSAIQQHGAARAVETVTAKYRTSIDGSTLVSGFSSDSAVESNVQLPRGPFVVFYHVAVTDGPANISVIAYQLKMLSQLSASSEEESIQVVVNIAGKQIHPSVVSLISEQCHLASHLNCSYVGQFDRNYEGETLGLVQQYCSQSPSSRVTFIHNGAPMKYRMTGANTNVIVGGTAAALDSKCQTAVPTSCNVCGLSFETMPFFAPLTNMFTASCEYVNRLVPPRQFELRMNEFVGELLLRRLRQQSVTTLFPDRAEFFGVDRYSVEAWIGSHPSILPCELAQWTHGNGHGVDLGMVAKNFSLALPQIHFPEEISTDSLQLVLSNEGLRVREYFLMQGHLLRWLHFYDELPRFDSWIWWAIPDGHTWLKAVRDYGHDAIDNLGSPHAIDTF